ncbi:HAMP domain-containing histidine kinase [Ancylobacter dichloromethanicus]|uniref:histidine kinase n=1 Tax=Ancylobacter dichloromethanicus TaxID=518825 RepID=A0A9W6JAQ5_9HYPH|nr:ATP-binding protein [Ancylobacter dichloromethanicus]MBS7553159.1 HAMP domain-containing histidine kinase [Ancylobacter dichloromethanicus]GLK72936.1 two-component sensor histidine kinase [Ancylobacter dichloromethanicus]
MATVSTGDTSDRKNLLLLIQLRWIAAIGQLVTIWFVDVVLAIALPLAQMLAVIAFLVALNLVSLLRYRHRERVSNTELFLELLLDVGALTAQLYLSGGAQNPFISLFLLQVILGAILLEAWSVWTLVAITSACFVGLTAFHRDILGPHGPMGGFWNLHIQGMFICFVLSACLLVAFITRINANLRARDARLAELRQQSAEEEHIVRMGLLASGAAHELGTPLSTLSVILNDWEKMPVLARDDELVQDMAEMQTQLARCKAIVTGILLSSGEARGEGTIRTGVRALLDEAVADWRAIRAPAALDYENAFEPDQAVISDLAVKQVIFNVLDNALEASPAWVGLAVRRQGDTLCVEVSDQGPGFPAHIAAEPGKPYRSTKARTGAGLGLFLVVNVLRRLGGAVEVQNRPGGGACVRLRLPLAGLSGGTP